MSILLSLALLVPLCLFSSATAHAAESEPEYLDWSKIDLSPTYPNNWDKSNFPKVPAQYNCIVVSRTNGGTYFLICSKTPVVFQCNSSNGYYVMPSVSLSGENRDAYVYWNSNGSWQNWLLYTTEYGLYYLEGDSFSSNYSMKRIPAFYDYKDKLLITTSELGNSTAGLNKISINVTNTSDYDVNLIFNISKDNSILSSSIDSDKSVYTYCQQVSGLSLLQGVERPDFESLIKTEDESAWGQCERKANELLKAWGAKEPLAKVVGSLNYAFANAGAYAQYCADWWADAWTLNNDAAATEEKKMQNLQIMEDYINKLNEGAGLYANGQNLAVGQTKTFEIPLKNVNLLEGNTYYLKIFFAGPKFLDGIPLYKQYACYINKSFVASELPNYTAPAYGNGNVNTVDSYNNTVINNYYNNTLPPEYVPPGSGGGSSSGSSSSSESSSSSSSSGGGTSSEVDPPSSGGSGGENPGGGSWWDKITGWITDQVKGIEDAINWVWNGITGLFDKIGSFFEFLALNMDFLPPELWTLVSVGAGASVLFKVFRRD